MSLKAYLLVALSFGHVSVLVLLLSYFIFVKNYLSLCRYYLHPAHRRYFVIVFNSLWSILRWMFDFLILVAWYRCSIEFTKLNTIPEFHTVCVSIAVSFVTVLNYSSGRYNNECQIYMLLAEAYI
jgi:hypothetical protein